MSAFTPKGQLFIAGEWVKGGGSLFQSVNPATGEIVWKGNEATSVDVDAAVASAAQAFFLWAERPLHERCTLLLRYAESLTRSKAFLAETISKETGKPLWESEGEVEAMIGKVPLSIDAYNERCQEKTKAVPQGTLYTRHLPHGVVAVLGPYNFPGHLPNGHIVPALLAGNAVVFKPSELTPRTAEEMVNIWQEAGLPPGLINLVQGGGQVGHTVAHHPGVRGLFFTGSYQTGLALSKFFSTDPGKILALEMGGNNPLLISKCSNLPAACIAIIQSAFLTTGQRCTCARRLILTDHSSPEELLSQLKKMMRSIVIGPYTDRPQPFMGPMVRATHAMKVLKSAERLRQEGAVSLIELHVKEEGSAFLFPGLVDVTGMAKRIDEEIFGPLLQVIRVRTLEEGIDEANDTQYGMSAGIITQDEKEFALFRNKVRAGVINWNTPLTMASSAAPFGGIKASGNFRPSAFYAADYCSYPVASLEAPAVNMPIKPIPGIPNS